MFGRKMLPLRVCSTILEPCPKSASSMTVELTKIFCRFKGASSSFRSRIFCSRSLGLTVKAKTLPAGWVMSRINSIGPDQTPGTSTGSSRSGFQVT